MAVREDEDVAQAMGINLVSTKLIAFAIGAGFSALSGAIFATKLGSVYPHSFNVMISINILCVIIVGGMGSIPGVIVGAAGAGGAAGTVARVCRVSPAGLRGGPRGHDAAQTGRAVAGSHPPARAT